MSKISKCLLKINKKPSVQIVEEKNEEEKELCFKKFTIKKEPNYEEPECELEQEQYEEPECELEQDEDYTTQQKKIGLMCNCGLTTILREVKKDGANKGKLFYTCSNHYDDKCDYFMWKDESDKKIGRNVEPPIKQEELEEKQEEEYDDKYYKQQQKLGLMCYCKLPSVSRQVKKDGTNKGKIFYTCSIYFDDKCKYFVWQDEIKK